MAEIFEIRFKDLIKGLESRQTLRIEEFQEIFDRIARITERFPEIEQDEALRRICRQNKVNYSHIKDLIENYLISHVYGIEVGCTNTTQSRLRKKARQISPFPKDMVLSIT
jgi:hypothetical protein